MQYKDLKLKEVLSQVLNVSPDVISDEASTHTIASWDSLRHMNLIVALEEEFDVQLSDEQVVEILSYKLIKLVLKEHGVEFSD